MGLEVAYLDRDGTINVDTGYPSDPDSLRFCPGAVEGLAHLQRLGLDLVVITNQSGVGRGYFDEATVDRFNRHLADRLLSFGVELAGFYVCPHGPDDGCSCRKPRPGLFHQAERDLGRRPAVAIGDNQRDVDAARAAGIETTILLGEVADHGERAEESYVGGVASDLRQAAQKVETLLQGAPC